MKSIGQKIKELRKREKLSQAELGKKAGGLSHATISRIENTNQGFTRKSLTNIANAFGLPDDYFYSISEVRRIPVIDKTRSDEWSDFSDLSYPAGVADRYEPSPSDDPNAFYIVAQGESMIGARIFPGDLLLVEPNREINSGNTVLAEHHGEKMVKKYFHRGDRIILQPMNPDLEPIEISGEDLKNFKAYRITKVMHDV